jgi:hypothetical protein
VYFFDNFEIVASADKNTFLIARIIKLTYDNIFIKVTKNPLGTNRKKNWSRKQKIRQNAAFCSDPRQIEYRSNSLELLRISILCI